MTVEIQSGMPIGSMKRIQSRLMATKMHHADEDAVKCVGLDGQKTLASLMFDRRFDNGLFCHLSTYSFTAPKVRPMTM